MVGDGARPVSTTGYDVIYLVMYDVIYLSGRCNYTQPS